MQTTYPNLGAGCAAAVFGHMLRKDPDRRIQTAADLSHAWRQFIEVGPSDSWNILDAFSGASDWS